MLPLVRAEDDHLDAAVEAIAVQAQDEGRMQALGPSAAQWRAWRAADLAALVEGCFQRVLDPARLDGDAEALWEGRLAGCFARPPVDGPREEERHFWILDQGERAGTIKLSASAHPWLQVGSLYVAPAHRGRGLAGALLARLARAAVAQGLDGLRLGTCWTWQKALRFYLSRGFWVWSWRYDIQLVLEPSLPERRVIIEGERARLEVAIDGEPRPLLRARRKADRLELDEISASEEVERRIGHRALATFATELALAGWPLVRSEASWAQRHRWLDAGQPEGLACRIDVFERSARERGWIVDGAR